MAHQSNSSALKTAIMSEHHALASAESQPQRMQARKRRSILDYSSETRDPVTIGTENPTFSKNTTQEYCENQNQNLQCMKDLPNSIDSIFAKAKSVVKIEGVTQANKVIAEVWDPRKSQLFNDRPRFQNVKDRKVFFPTSPEWFHLGSRDAPLVRDVRKIAHLEILPQTDSSGDSFQSDYVMLKKAMTDKNQIVGGNSSDKLETDHAPSEYGFLSNDVITDNDLIVGGKPSDRSKRQILP